MDLKLACADFTFPLLSHENALKLIGMTGVQGADIGLFEGRSHLQPHDVLPNIKGSAASLSALARDAGVDIADIFVQQGTTFEEMAVNHPDADVRRENRETFLRFIEFASLCKAPHMTQLPGVPWPNETEHDSMKRCSEELAWRVQQCCAANIVFSIEAHIGSIVPTPQKVSELVEMTPGLTLTLDYTHFTSQGTPDDQIEPLVKHAGHFHCRGARTGRLQAPFKENTVNYEQVLREMNRTGYRGYVGIEYVWIDWQHCNEVDNLCETILYRNYLQETFRKLKGN